MTNSQLNPLIGKNLKVVPLLSGTISLTSAWTRPIKAPYKIKSIMYRRKFTFTCKVNCPEPAEDDFALSLFLFLHTSTVVVRSSDNSWYSGGGGLCGGLAASVR